MTLAPQERLALGTVSLLLALGGIVQALGPRPPSAEWEGAPAVALAETGLEAQTEAEVAREVRRSTPLAVGERLDPSTASADELQRLPRVGPALAARIVAWRTEQGSFRTLADLDAVPGIGPATLDGLAPYLTLAGASSLPAAPSGSRAGLATTVAAAGLPVDLNRAGAAELETLPGIGPAIARRIIAYREEHGAFRSASELENVQGIGPRTLERIAPQVRAGP